MLSPSLPADSALLVLLPLALIVSFNPSAGPRTSRTNRLRFLPPSLSPHDVDAPPTRPELAAPEITQLYAANFPASAIRAKVRQEYERNALVSDLATVDILLLKGYQEYQEVGR